VKNKTDEKVIKRFSVKNKTDEKVAKRFSVKNKTYVNTMLHIVKK
jgi:ribosomal protein L35